MRHAKRMLCALLAALLLVTPLLAAGPYAGEHAKRMEDLTFLVEALEKAHPELYANTTPQAMAEKKAYIAQNMDNWSDTALSLEYRSLIGMVGDSHTNMGVKVADHYRKLLMSIEWLGDKWILTGALKEYRRFVGGEILTMGDLSMAQVQQRFGTSLCADNDAWAKRVMGQWLSLWDILLHTGVVKADQQTLELTVRDRDGVTGTVTVSPLSNDECNALVASGQMQEMAATLQTMRTGVPATEPDSVYYQWMDLGDGDLYIQYNACFEDPDLPMADFAAQIAGQLQTDTYDRVILDLRYNGGGSDGVIWDLLYAILPYYQQGTDLYALIGTGTFSSALINAVQLKQLGAVLVGTPTGGSVDHFGAIQSFALPNSGWKISHSTKFIDMGGYYEAAAPYGVESLPPDIHAAQTVSDYLSGTDTAVEAVRSIPVTAAVRTATASAISVTVNGNASDLRGYEVGGEFYVGLRDAAMALTGTAAQFDVAWHEADNVAEVIPGQAYRAVGGELTAPTGETQPTRLAAKLLMKPGLPVQMLGAPGPLSACRIGTQHYVHLAELGAKLGFTVRLDGGIAALTTG